MDEIEEQKILDNARKRQRKRQTSNGTFEDHSDTDTEIGSGFEAPGRDATDIQGPGNETGSLNSRVQKEQSQPGTNTKRSRGTNRRSRQSDSRPNDTLSESEDPVLNGFSRLEATEELPPRPVSSFVADDIEKVLAKNPKISDKLLAKKLGCSVEEAHKRREEFYTKPSTHIKPESTIPQDSFLKQMKTLSKEEAEQIFEPFLEALESDFYAIDQWLWARQTAKGIEHHQDPVWSDFDEEQSQKLGKVLIKWGQKNPIVATGVRATVEAGDYVAVASMLAPRFKRTVEIYKETKLERKSRYSAFKRPEKTEPVNV